MSKTWLVTAVILAVFALPLSAAEEKEGTAKPEAAKPDVTKAADSEDGKKSGPVPETTDKEPASPGPHPANVILVSGKKLEKVWVENKTTGSWVTHEGERFWYLKKNIVRIEYLVGAASEEMKKSLNKAQKAKEEEDERTKKTDEGETPEETAEAGASDSVTEGKKVASDTTSKKRSSSSSSSGSGSGSGWSVSSSTFVPQTVQGEVSSNRGSSGGGGGGSARDNHRRRRPWHHRRWWRNRMWQGAYSGFTAAAQDVADGGDGTGAVSGGGTGIGGATGTGGSVQGVGGDTGTGGGITGDPDQVHLAFQWRVKWVNHRKGLIRVKNRLLHRGLTLAVKDLNDLKGVKKGQILTGKLTVDSPVLNSPNGNSIEFQVAGSDDLVVRP